MNITTDLINIVRKFSPLVATALGSPVAGWVVSGLCHIFGVAEPETLAAAITQDPTAQDKLKQFEAQCSSELAVTGINAVSSAYQVDQTDRASARGMQLEIKKYQWVAPALCLLITLGFFMSIMIIMLDKPDNSDHDILYMMLGVLGATFTQVCNFYLGSSNGERSIGSLAENMYQMHSNYVSALSQHNADS